MPLREQTVGALVQLARRMSPSFKVDVRPCKSGTAWPIAYVTGERLPRPPVGFEVLKMEGDALLTFDDKNRDAPTINLCADLALHIDATHRVRAIALWDSTDESAFDPAHPEVARAPLAFLELYTRSPSTCALGVKEAPGTAGDPVLAALVACAEMPLVVAARAGCEERAERLPVPAEKAWSALEVEKKSAATHRYTGPGRSIPPTYEPFQLERRELCLHEPAPAERDVCLAVYTDESGKRWYGRADVMRTGAGGVKNYVDSYLTFNLLKRIEAERKAGKPAPEPGTPSKN